MKRKVTRTEPYQKDSPLSDDVLGLQQRASASEYDSEAEDCESEDENDDSTDASESDEEESAGGEERLPEAVADRQLRCKYCQTTTAKKYRRGVEGADVCEGCYMQRYHKKKTGKKVEVEMDGRAPVGTKKKGRNERGWMRRKGRV